MGWLAEGTGDILDQTLKTGYQTYLRLCQELGADIREVHRETQEVLHSKRVKGAGPCPLELRWYESLEAGEPDFTVYDDDDYLGFTWECWVSCSRKYLRAIRNAKLLAGFPPGTRVLDLGCGLGFTTVALRQMMPDSTVIATNLETSRQMTAVRLLGDAYGFTAVGSLAAAGEADIVFASEYFEHIQHPVAHLEEVLALGPRMLVMANTFGHPSVGHFDTTGYQVGGRTVMGRRVSRAFSDALRDRGFARVETGFWNNRPACWELAGASQDPSGDGSGFPCQGSPESPPNSAPGYEEPPFASATAG